MKVALFIVLFVIMSVQPALAASPAPLPEDVQRAAALATAELQFNGIIEWIDHDEFISRYQIAKKDHDFLRKAVGFRLGNRIFLFKSNRFFRALTEDSQNYGCDLFGKVTSMIIYHEIMHGVEPDHTKVYLKEIEYGKKIIHQASLDPSFRTKEAQTRLKQYVDQVRRDHDKLQKANML